MAAPSNVIQRLLAEIQKKRLISFGGGSTLGATGGAIFIERGGGTGPHPPGQQNGHFQTPVYKKVSDGAVQIYMEERDQL